MKNLKFILFTIVHLVFLAHSARAYYDPATGQFLSREPLGENESLNLYTYGHNDPVNNVDVLGLQAVSVTSQEMSDTLRSRWLLELVASGLQHPESPTADQTRTYANYFGLTKPFTDADYDRAASLAGGLMVNHGRPSARTPSWEETELAKQPGMMPYVAPPAVQTAALSIGAPSSSAFYADMNAAFLLPIGAEGFIFSGALSGLRVGGIMATGASFERAMLLNGITSELGTGAMLARTGGANSAMVCGKLVQAGNAVNETGLNWVSAMAKGSRPHPARYLSVAERNSHLALFQGGAVRIGPIAPTGMLGRTETWVFPRSTVDVLIKQASGDVAKLEQLLGLDAGYLGKSPVLIDIPHPQSIRLPTGNEFGANSFWEAGGVTSGGLPEAIIAPVPPGAYFVRPVFGL